MRQPHGPDAGAKRIIQQNPPRKRIAEGHDLADHLQRLHRAHHAGERAEHARLRAGRAFTVRSLAHEAAPAGLVRLPAAIGSDLAFEWPDRRRDERDAQRERGIGDRAAGFKAVGTVGDHVVACEQRYRVCCVEADAVLRYGDVGVELRDRRCGAFCLRHAHIVSAVQHLPLKIRKIDGIVVDDRKMPDTRRREILDAGAAEPARADDGDAGGEQLRLARPADFLQDDVAGVAFELLVGKAQCRRYRPVEPKPPVPRAVSSRSSTSAKCACCTGAATSCAIRSPRFTAKGSAPRLARITFTSPR